MSPGEVVFSRKWKTKNPQLLVRQNDRYIKEMDMTAEFKNTQYTDERRTV